MLYICGFEQWRGFKMDKKHLDATNFGDRWKGGKKRENAVRKMSSRRKNSSAEHEVRHPKPEAHPSHSLERNWNTKRILLIVVNACVYIIYTYILRTRTLEMCTGLQASITLSNSCNWWLLIVFFWALINIDYSASTTMWLLWPTPQAMLMLLSECIV